jgi:hypothetical protein
MKISSALLRIILLTYGLASTSTTLAHPTTIPPASDGYVNTRSNLLQVDGTDLALGERGADDSNDIEHRQLEEGVLLVVVASAVVTGVVAGIVSDIESDDPVSRNSITVPLKYMHQL